MKQYWPHVRVLQAKAGKLWAEEKQMAIILDRDEERGYGKKKGGIEDERK